MGQTQGPEESKAAFVQAATTMYEELKAWRGQHLEASLDEIAAEVGVRRRALMGALLSELAAAADERVVAPVCEQCGVSMTYKGRPRRGVLLGEGEMALVRAYWYCDSCQEGVFPPGQMAEVKQASVECQDHPTGTAAGGGDPIPPKGS